MKKLITLSLCVLGFFLIGAPTSVESTHPVFVNGKPFATAVMINGQPALKLKDFATAGGAQLTLEPFFTRQANTLLATLGTASLKHGDVKYKDASTVAGVKIDTVKIKAAPGQIFYVVKPGTISGNLITVRGETFVPLSDVMTSFTGNTTNPATFTNLKPGEPIRLNFSKNQNSIIAVLIGL